MIEKEKLRSKILQCRKEIRELYHQRDQCKTTWKKCLYTVQEAHREKNPEKAKTIALKMHRVSKKILNMENQINTRTMRQRDLQTQMVLLKVKMGEL
jgi:hypothetical protein